MNMSSDSVSPHLSITRIYTALVSLTLSVFAFYSDDLINSDGIMYLQMAQTFLDGGLEATKEIYDWPFFSILIAGFHNISSLSLQLSATIINCSLFVIFTDALVLISSRLVNNRFQLVTAAILILSFYPINEYRDFIIRDIGYWAFCSVALYHLIKFIQQPKLLTATYWQVAISFATLFRVEGLVFFLALPLYSFFIDKPAKAFKHYVQLLYLLLSGGVLLSVTVIGQTGITSAFGKVASIANYLNPEPILRHMDRSSDIIADRILNQYSYEYSTMILVAGLLYMLIFKLVKAYSFSYIALSIMGIWREKKLFVSSLQPLFIFLILINVFVLSVFLFRHYFISSRYAVMVMIGFLLLFLPIIVQTFEKAWHQKQKWAVSIAAVLIVVSLVDAFAQSNSKSYIRETARWASQHLPAGSLVLTDDQFLHYYFTNTSPSAMLCVGPIYQKANRVDYRGVTPAQKQQCRPYVKQGYSAFDYLLVVEKKRNAALKGFLASISKELVFEQKNTRGNKASLYKIIKVE